MSIVFVSRLHSLVGPVLAAVVVWLPLCPETRAGDVTACSSLVNNEGFPDPSTSAESNPTAISGRTIDKCPGGALRVARINNNGAKITKCATVENCGTSSATTTTKLCYKLDTNKFPVYYCATKNN